MGMSCPVCASLMKEMIGVWRCDQCGKTEPRHRKEQPDVLRDADSPEALSKAP